MSSEDSDIDMDCTPPYIKAEAELAKNNLLPPKSKERYMSCYEKFIKWKEDKHATSWSENVFLAYFNNLRLTMKPNSLWSIYSMIRSVVLNKHNVNLRKYTNLTAWLKRQSDGYQAKKSKIFNSQQIQQFLNDAPDDKYLVMKVVLIMGINGACRSMELANIKTNDVEYHDDIILVTNKTETKTKVDRSFVIREESVNMVKKYQDLRPKDTKTNNFFINYKNGKCTRQNIGRHRIAAMPREIAEYLELSFPETYAGHCFRRSSATLLADSGANITTLKRHGGWKSDQLAEGYIDDSVENRSKITSQINDNIKLNPLNSPESSTSRHQPIHASPQPSTSRQEPQNSSPEPPTSRPKCQVFHPTSSTSHQPINSQTSQKSDILQTNISVPGKSITISLNNCPNMSNVTFNIS